MSIAVVVGVLLIQILVQNNGLFYQQQAKVSQGLSLNDATSEIGSDIKSSSGVASGYPASSPTTLSSLGSLVLLLPSIDSSGNVISNTYDYLVITQDSKNNQILREITYPDPSSSRPSGNKVLVNNLSLINFYYLDSNGNGVSPASATQVRFVLNVLDNFGNNNKQSSSSAQITLRNS